MKGQSIDRSGNRLQGETKVGKSVRGMDEMKFHRWRAVWSPIVDLLLAVEFENTLFVVCDMIVRIRGWECLKDCNS
jgi:hypothetical protein